MAIATLAQIKNAIGVGARPNLFRVTFAGGISAGPTSQISVLCKAAALPGSTVGLIEVPQIGGKRYKLAGDRTFAEWTTTVLNDRDFNVRTALENYQKRFVGTDFGVPVIGDRSSTLTTVTVEQLNQNSSVVRSYRLQNCFISDLSTIDLSYDSTDAIEEFTVTWVYDYFTVS